MSSRAFAASALIVLLGTAASAQPPTQAPPTQQPPKPDFVIPKPDGPVPTPRQDQPVVTGSYVVGAHGTPQSLLGGGPALTAHVRVHPERPTTVSDPRQ